MHQLFIVFITSSHSFMREGLAEKEEGKEGKYTVDPFWWRRTERREIKKKRETTFNVSSHQEPCVMKGIERLLK